jgi:hypothetical protein
MKESACRPEEAAEPYIPGEPTAHGDLEVVMNMEDPGKHTDRREGPYEITYERAKRTDEFRKKLVGILSLKGLDWAWGWKIPSRDPKYEWARAEIKDIVETHEYRTVVTGRKEKHSNRPGNGRKAKQKFNNNCRLPVRYAPGRHDVQLGTMTEDIVVAQ